MRLELINGGRRNEAMNRFMPCTQVITLLGHLNLQLLLFGHTTPNRKRAFVLWAENVIHEEWTIYLSFVNYHEIIFTNTDVFLALRAFDSSLTLSHLTTQLFSSFLLITARFTTCIRVTLCQRRCFPIRPLHYHWVVLETKAKFIVRLFLFSTETSTDAVIAYFRGSATESVIFCEHWSHSLWARVSSGFKGGGALCDKTSLSVCVLDSELLWPR